MHFTAYLINEPFFVLTSATTTTIVTHLFFVVFVATVIFYRYLLVYDGLINIDPRDAKKE